MKTIGLFLTITLLAGCGAQPGRTIYTQGTGPAPVEMGTAPVTGAYALYTAFSPNPTVTVKLKAGDPLGFRKTAAGQIEAVDGKDSTVLGAPTVQAYWKLIPTP